MNRRVLLVALMVLAVAVLAGVSSVLFWQAPALAAETTTGLPVDPGVVRWGYLAAALATGLGSLGAAYAVGTVGAAAVGAITEKPELFGQVLILIGLAEGIAIYGVIIAVLILNRLS